MISRGLHGVTAGSLECVLILSSISVALKGSQWVAMLNVHCAKIVLGTIDIVGGRKLHYA